MADRQRLLAREPRRAAQASLPFIGDASNVVDSEITADTSPSRYAHSLDATDGSNDNPHKGYDRMFGFGIDHTGSDNLRFPGFGALQYFLSQEAIHYLVSDRRWSNPDDSSHTVGQKNTIIIFVGLATIEECLVDEKSGKLLSVSGPFEALMDTLDIRNQPCGVHRSHKFLSGIRNKFVKSRCDEIKRHLGMGNGSPPEPNDLSGLDRMVLDVVDRHIAFLRTKKPLTRLCAPFPSEKALKLRLSQVRSQLRNKECIEQCFTTFVPTIPAHQQTPWPRARTATALEAAEAKHSVNSSGAVDTYSSKHQGYGLKIKPEAPCDVENIPAKDLGPDIPGTTVDGPASPSQCAPALPASQPNALSGLQLFKTAASHVYTAIEFCKDSTNLKEFVGKIEEDVKEFQETIQPRYVPARVDYGGSPRPQVDVPLDPEYIRSLMLIGLLLVSQKWNEQNLSDNTRQKILGDILEEVRMIKEAVEQVYSAQA